MVNLVEWRLPIGRVLSKNATQKRMKSHVGGQGANKEKLVVECWMQQQALIGQSGRIKASYWSSRV